MHINWPQSGKKKGEKGKKTWRKPLANINVFTFLSPPCLVLGLEFVKK